MSIHIIDVTSAHEFENKFQEANDHSETYFINQQGYPEELSHSEFNVLRNKHKHITLIRGPWFNRYTDDDSEVFSAVFLVHPQH